MSDHSDEGVDDGDVADENAAGEDVTGESASLSATDAFQLLAHDTRLTAMEVLWDAEEPLRFSEIASRGDVTDTGNFNYHFGKLVGHFVRPTGEAYELTRSGRQAMTAVLAGDVTDRPAFESVTLDETCPYCEDRIELDHDADVLRVRCTSCPGTFEGEHADAVGTANPPGTITTFALPPAALRARDPGDVLDVALVRLVARYRSMTEGVCPDCAGPVTRTASVCDDHDPDGVCANCTSRFLGLVRNQCETCGNTRTGLLALVALADPDVRRFFQDHGYEPLRTTWPFVLAFLDADERVHAVDPVDYEATWTLDDETLHVRIEEPGTVVDVERAQT